MSEPNRPEPNRHLDPNRHIRKKRLRDLDRMIRKVRLRMYNKKAKRNIPQLQAKMNALQKAYNEALRGNIQNMPKKIMEAPKLCPVCNGRIGKGYHICKPGPWKR